MNNVQRYDERCDVSEIRKQDDGGYVKYEDYQKLKAEMAEARKALLEKADQWMKCPPLNPAENDFARGYNNGVLACGMALKVIVERQAKSIPCRQERSTDGK